MSTTRSLQTRVCRHLGRAMRKSDLSSGRRWLVETMQEVAFGRLMHLILVKGEPLPDLPPRIYQDRRLTGPNQCRPEAELGDFLLKEQVVALFEELDRIGSAVIAVLEVRDGLPYGMTLEQKSGKWGSRAAAPTARHNQKTDSLTHRPRCGGCWVSPKRRLNTLPSLRGWRGRSAHFG